MDVQAGVDSARLVATVEGILCRFGHVIPSIGLVARERGHVTVMVPQSMTGTSGLDVTCANIRQVPWMSPVTMTPMAPLRVVGVTHVTGRAPSGTRQNITPVVTTVPLTVTVTPWNSTVSRGYPVMAGCLSIVWD